MQTTMTRMGQDHRLTPSVLSGQGEAAVTSTCVLLKSCRGGPFLASAFLALALHATSAPGATNFTVLRPFGFPEKSGSHPRAEVIRSGNALYGTTYEGGSNNWGTVFKVNTDGSNYTVLWTFTRNGVAGRYPIAPLVEDREDGGGQFYGVTAEGGSQGGGTVFRVSSSGGDLQVLHAFATNGVDDGYTPLGGLVQGSDFVLYGVTFQGGANGRGTIFKVNTDGTDYSNLWNFSSSGVDGRNPESGLVEGRDGALYGVTSLGGSDGVGIVFRINKNGSGFAVLRSFSSTGDDGQNPQATLMQNSIDDMLYGTTVWGGTSTNGTVFRIRTNGTDYAVLKSFNSEAGDGSVPYGTLVEGDDLQLYGTTYDGGEHGYGTIFLIERGGMSYEVLWNFNGTDGRYPEAGLAQGSGGDFYGTTSYGGSNGLGTVFRYSPSVIVGGLDTLWNFTDIGEDGNRSEAGLVEGSQGLLYGTTRNGGTADLGTLFRIRQDGTGYALLQSFTNANGDGPRAVLIEASDGALYGTTIYGGTNGGGTVFKITTNGTGHTILRHLGGPNDGKYPQAGVIEGKSDGALYGTCYMGGTNDEGVVFKLNKDGSGYEILRSFGSSSGGDARKPYGGLLEGSDGVLYGTTSEGGSNHVGAVFKINKNGTDYGILRSFLTSGGDGQQPRCALVEGSDGALYGTTYSGGASNVGSVFRINKNGTGYARVWSLSTSGGGFPASGVIDGRDGLLYGTARSEGNAGYGTLFCLYRNGSGYRVLKHFGREGDGQYPNGLLQGSDGAIYGTTTAGGDMSAGNVFKLVPPPVGQLAGISRQGVTNLILNGTGEASFAYLVQANTNLLLSASWKTIATNLTDSSGAFTYTDPAMANHIQRFYRLRWP